MIRWGVGRLVVMLTVMWLAIFATSAVALTPIAVNDAADRVDVSSKSEFYSGRGYNLHV